MATAPGEELLVGRRPVRSWTQIIFSLFHCELLHLFLSKSTKTAPTRAALFDSNMHQIVCRLGLCPDPTGGAYSVPPDALAVFRRPTSKGRGGEGRDGGSSPFALGRTKKSRRLCRGGERYCNECVCFCLCIRMCASQQPTTRPRSSPNFLRMSPVASRPLAVLRYVMCVRSCG